jgi:gliding motility-associated-like protein
MYNKSFYFFSAIKNIFGFLCLFFSVNLIAQHDLSLSLENSTGLTQIGDTTVFNLKIENINQTDVTGLAVQLGIPATLDFIEAVVPIGTSFSEATGNWDINSQLTNTVDAFDLMLKFSSTIQGTQFLQAEISAMDGFDLNSTPANGDVLEDDMAVGCVTIPIQIGMSDTVQLAAPTMTGGGHVWSHTTDMETTVVSNAMMYDATEIGIYSYSNDLLECNVMSCCDIVLVEEELCDNALNDNEAPILTDVPANAIMSCSEVSNPVMPIAIDNYDTDVEVYMSEVQVGSGCNYQIIRTWTATDDCDNSSTVSQTIQVQDTEAPVIIPTHPLLIGLNSGDEITIECNTPFALNPTDVMVTDDCDDNVFVTIEEEEIIIGDCLIDGFTVWMHCYFEAVDDCGNTSQFFVKIKIVDTTAATFFAVPANTTIDCHDGLPVVVNPIVSDNCTNNQDLNIVFTENQEGSGCNYQIIRTWTTTDDCGNVASTSQIITVQDNEAPIITGVANDITINLSVGEITPAVSTNITANDNCTTNPSLTFNEIQNGEGCSYQIIRTWTATDDCENTTIGTQIITVNDVITSVAVTTTTDNCEMSTGTAIITPASYNYLWSNGLIGANQVNLIAGTYTVTVTNAAACTSIFEVIIEAACDCIEFVIEQENYTDATCNDNNGVATIIPEGDLIDYTYLWTPNLGISNTMGNSHTNLPAGDYLVIILFQGNPDCEEEVEFTIDNDFSDCGLTSPVSVDFLVLSEETITYDCNEEEARLCIDIAYGDFMSNYTLMNNGLPYSGETRGCNFITNYAYNFAPVADYGNVGPYLISWEINGQSQTAEVNNIYAIADQLNLWDEGGHWSVNEITHQVISASTDNEYGYLDITQMTTEIASNLALNSSSFALSTQLTLPSGINELVVINQSNNTQDEFIVRAACVTSEVIENTITVGQQDEMCLDIGELLGEFISIENICEAEGSAAATLENVDGTYCISCIGVEEGDDKACFVICDEYDICDTTYLQITVIERSDENSSPDLVIYSGFSPNGDNINETFTIKGLENYSKHSLDIFNRWGQNVFSSKDYQNDWNGTYYDKMLPNGTYFYVLDLDDNKTQSGYIQMSR